MSNMILAEPSESIPLTLTLETPEAGFFPRAQVLTEAGAALGSPVDLSAVAGQDGTYLGSYTVPATAGQFPVRYTVYEDAGHTTLSTKHGAAQDVIVVRAGASVPLDVWSVLRSTAVPTGSYGEALRMLMGTMGKANMRIDKMVYDGNGFLTSAKLRVFPDDTTAAASTSRATANTALEGAIFEIDLTGTVDSVHLTLPSSMLGVLTTP